jgi:biopolymer transport protein ExbD
MFLLLIFFMLSSQISPYSLLPVGAVAAPGSDEDKGNAAAETGGNVLVRVSRAGIAIDGEPAAAANVGALLRHRVEEGAAGFVVVATATATVQDLVSTLEALRAAGAANVTLVSGGGRAS